MSEGTKPCGHGPHPEDGNVGRVDPSTDPRADVAAHRDEPAWFVGRYVKLGFPIPGHEPKNEYLWLHVQRAVTGALWHLEGRVANVPLHVNFRFGDRVAFTTDKIVDVTDEADP